jgi:hypothetical protein
MIIICHQCQVPTDETEIDWDNHKIKQVCSHCTEQETTSEQRITRHYKLVGLSDSGSQQVE